MNGNELLPSSSQGAAKSAVLEFVGSVSRPGASYVPPAERIATFDNDGTLGFQKPRYVQADFVFRRRKQMVEADPAKAREQPYKALVENDQAWLKNLLDHVPDLVKGVTEAYEGITVETFEQAVWEFFATATHPTLGLPYTKVGYQPMRGAARPAPRAIEILIAPLHADARRTLARDGVLAEIGEDHIYDSVQAAVAASNGSAEQQDKSAEQTEQEDKGPGR